MLHLGAQRAAGRDVTHIPAGVHQARGRPLDDRDARVSVLAGGEDQRRPVVQPHIGGFVTGVEGDALLAHLHPDFGAVQADVHIAVVGPVEDSQGVFRIAADIEAIEAAGEGRGALLAVDDDRRFRLQRLVIGLLQGLGTQRGQTRVFRMVPVLGRQMDAFAQLLPALGARALKLPQDGGQQVEEREDRVLALLLDRIGPEDGRHDDVAPADAAVFGLRVLAQQAVEHVAGGSEGRRFLVVRRAVGGSAGGGLEIDRHPFTPDSAQGLLD